jgi:hypothetical protein
MIDEEQIQPLSNAPWWVKLGISIVVFVTASIASIWRHNAKNGNGHGEGNVNTEQRLSAIEADIRRLVDYEVHNMLMLDRILSELLRKLPP